jgi:hypothetical protein
MDPSLGGHQQNAQHFTDTRKPATVDLAHIDSLRLEKLFEYHSVVGVLASRDTDSMGL